MNNIEFLNLAIDKDTSRDELKYIYQLKVDEHWYTFTADDYVMHVISESLYPQDMPVIVTVHSTGDIEQADQFLQKNRDTIASMIKPTYETPVTLFFDRDHLKRILDYAADETRIALIIQRPQKSEKLFDFRDSTTCFAFIEADSALFSLGNVRGTVGQNTTIYLFPELLKRALSGLNEPMDVQFDFDAAHPDKPVMLGNIHERFAVIMPMNPPVYGGSFLADFVGGYGERDKAVSQ